MTETWLILGAPSSMARAFARALRPRDLNRAGPAGNRQIVIQCHARIAKACCQTAAQQLHTLACHDTPRTRERRQTADQLAALCRRPRPVNARFGLVNLGGIGDAVVRLRFRRQRCQIRQRSYTQPRTHLR